MNLQLWRGALRSDAAFYVLRGQSAKTAQALPYLLSGLHAAWFPACMKTLICKRTDMQLHQGSSVPKSNCKLHRIFDSHLLEGNVTQLQQVISTFPLHVPRVPTNPLDLIIYPQLVPFLLYLTIQKRPSKIARFPKPSPKHRRHSPPNSPAPS